MLLLIILGIDWASGFAIAGFVMRHGVSPSAYAFWQCFGPLLALFIIQVIRNDVKYYPGGLRYGFICGALGIALPNLIIYYSSRYIDSGILTVFANLDPICTYILVLLFHQEKFNKTKLFLVSVGVVGVILLLAQSHVQNIYTLSLHNGWLYLVLLVPICYSLGVIYLAKLKPKDGNVLNYSFWMLLFASIITIPVTLIDKNFYPLSFNYNSLLIILEIILSTIGYILLFIIIPRFGPVFFMLVNGISAITGIVYGKFIFHQSMTNITYLAVTLIILSIIGMYKFK